MLKTKHLLFLILFTCLSYAGPLPEFTHFIKNNFLDSRAGGLGGAYVGLSDTLVGTYYNPAGLAFMDVKRKTESSNLYQQSTLNYSSDITDLTYKFSSNTNPYVGFFQSFNNVHLAFSIIVPKSETFNKDNHEINTYSTSSGLYTVESFENLDGFNIQYLIGPSASTLIQDNLSVGVSLFYSQETRNYNQNAFSKLLNSASELEIWTNDYYEESMHEVLAILGVQWMPIRSIAIGSSLHIAMPLSGSGTEQNIASEYISTDNIRYTSSATTSSYDLKSLGFQSNYNQLLIGATYFNSPSTLFALDLQYMFGSKENNSLTFASSDTLNIALGAEHYVLSYLPIRLGFYTNNSYFPDNLDGVHIDTTGLTLSVGFDNGQHSLNFLIDYQNGSGFETADSVKAYDITYNSLSYLISGSTNF